MQSLICSCFHQYKWPVEYNKHTEAWSERQQKAALIVVHKQLHIACLCVSCCGPCGSRVTLLTLLYLFLVDIYRRFSCHVCTARFSSIQTVQLNSASQICGPHISTTFCRTPIEGYQLNSGNLKRKELRAAPPPHLYQIRPTFVNLVLYVRPLRRPHTPPEWRMASPLAGPCTELAGCPRDCLPSFVAVCRQL